MARIAVLMDRIMESFGLSGKSFIPMIIGFGCNVPSIMAARSIENEKRAFNNDINCTINVMLC